MAQPSVYRKASMDRIQSPEQLNDYLRVTNPSVWILLAAVALILAGMLLWGSFAYIDSFAAGSAEVKGGVMTVTFQDESQAANVKAGMDVTVGDVSAPIANYAYGGGEGSASVRFDVEPEPRAAVITFTDGGVPFDPLEMKAPDTSLSAGQRKTGGLGIFMVRKLMDEVSYKYEGGRNVLTVKKLF